MPDKPHEIFSSLVNVLLSLYFGDRGVEFLGTDSANQEVDGEAAAQPDQSYCIEGVKPVPDLAIEIVFE
ncbi:hypothetical protein [Romeriopsis navalis]|nr:hypothetical protein [Romeriopsis navalis]